MVILHSYVSIPEGIGIIGIGGVSPKCSNKQTDMFSLMKRKCLEKTTGLS